MTETPQPTFRIGIHLEALWPGQIGGAERHLRQLIALWPTLDPDLELVLALAPHNSDTFEASDQVEKRVLDSAAFGTLNAAALASWRLDAWFCPLLTLEPAAPGVPAAVVVPDLQHETFPENFSDEILAWRRHHFARSARDADRILTVSAFSRRDILARLPVPDPDRVIAIHHGPAPHFTHAAAQDVEKRRAVRAHYGLQDGYVLYPAHGWPHKNHQTLFRALAHLEASTTESPQLVLTGGGADPTWPGRWQALGIEHRVSHLGHVSDSDMPAIYAGAGLLVFPSRFEGFGLPLIEAMISGCPVLTSRTTSLVEVGGDAVAYADCDDAEALAAAMATLLADPKQRADLASRGRKRARRFSAARSAIETLDVLRNMTGRPPLQNDLPRTRAVSVEEAPLITVITPSFQQAEFLPRTLDSVLDQDYPHLQYLIMDGGSQDGSVEILERYRKAHPQRIDYISEPDGGQAAAVNKGLDRARGAIIGWLNSDDVYRPGTLSAVADAFGDHPDRAWLYGHADYIDSNGSRLGPYPTRDAFDWPLLAHNCYLCQPAAFWAPSRLGDDVRLDPNLSMCMDYDLWIRLGQSHQPLFLDRVLAASRVHDATKTLGQRSKVFEETIGTVERHYGYVPVAWVAGKAHQLWQRNDDPLFPGRIARGTWALAALLVARYNPKRPAYVLRAWGELLREMRRQARSGSAKTSADAGPGR